MRKEVDVTSFETLSLHFCAGTDKNHKDLTLEFIKNSKSSCVTGFQHILGKPFLVSVVYFTTMSISKLHTIKCGLTYYGPERIWKEMIMAQQTGIFLEGL
jgi:hypothetical protein